MRTKYYISNNRGNKPITKKDLCLIVGADTVKRLTADAKRQFMADPYVLNQYMMHPVGLVTIEFSI